MNRKEFAALLADPLISQGNDKAGHDRPINEADLERILLGLAKPEVMPGSVMTMAGLRLSAV